MRLMMYDAYQAQMDLTDPLRIMARATSAILAQPWLCWSNRLSVRNVAALSELMGCTVLTHERPAYGIGTVRVGNREVEVREEAIHVAPFCTLLRFKKEIETVQPRVLLVAPISGHFSTLMRETVRTMLPDNDVYITDWHNARDVPRAKGRFDMDDCIDTLIAFLEVLGPGAHMVAVCQPSPIGLAAVAVMAQDGNPAQPRSLTLMAGPIDTRINPTKVDELALTKPIEWFERNLISTVPAYYAGAGRRVYPGFVQLTAFMSMNLDRHMKSFRELFNHRVKRHELEANSIRTFYEEYFAVMDMTAEFYLQTVRTVFQEHALPRGRLESRGRKIEPRAIRRTMLLTVEGERDDICAVGQTLAAQDLCSGLPPYMKRHYMQAGVGHYGVFNGRRWHNEVYPIVRDVILASDRG